MCMQGRLEITANDGFLQFSESKINTYKEEYELGRKHLANMMGIPEEEMTQEHVDVSIYMYFQHSPDSVVVFHLKPVVIFPHFE